MNQNTPFRAVDREELEVGGSRVIKGANGDEVAFVQFDEDAAFIVKACNSHEQLVAAVKAAKTLFAALDIDIMDCADYGNGEHAYKTIDRINSALEAAGVQP